MLCTMDFHTATPSKTIWFGDAQGTSPSRASWNVSTNTGNAYLGVRVELTTSPGSVSSWNIALNAPTFYVTSTAYPHSPVLTQFSSQGWVNLPKPNPALDPNPRTSADCPHLQAGLKLWHNPSTWPSNVVPDPAQSITLPPNTKVLVTASSFQTGIYTFIGVPENSELIFADETINLNVKSIFVQGAFRIGSPTCRLDSSITITFHGNKTTDNTICDNGCGAKGIVANGTLDIHGYQYHPTWTRLAATVWPGDDRIYLQDPVNWQVGQQIAITTTLREDYYNYQNEEHTILAISSDRKVIQVSKPFQASHYGGVEYQAEVALLSRRIKLQGDPQSEAQSFGGHLMIRPNKVAGGALGRISGVEFFRMGQTNMLAKYPVHFHLLQSCPGCFAKDCSVHKSFYRCYTLHATHDALLTRNVAYDVTGHCYYLEEGVEENNTVSYNFAGMPRVVYC